MFRIPFFSLCLLICVGSSNAADKYKIDLDRKYKVGQRFRLDVKANITNEITMHSGGFNVPGGKTSRDDSFVAEVEVIQLSDRGLPIEVNMIVDECRITTNDGTEDLLKPGTVIAGRVEDGEANFYSNGEPCTGLVLQKLQMFAELDVGGSSYNDAYGTNEEVGVGDNWKPDMTQVQEISNDMNIQIDPTKMKGECKLARLTDVEDEACMEIVSEIKIDDIEIKNMDLPLKPEKTSMQQKQIFLIPLQEDRTIRKFQLLTNTRLELKMPMEGGKIIDSSYTMIQSYTVDYVPLPE